MSMQPSLRQAAQRQGLYRVSLWEYVVVRYNGGSPFRAVFTVRFGVLGHEGSACQLGPRGCQSLCILLLPSAEIVQATIQHPREWFDNPAIWEYH